MKKHIAKILKSIAEQRTDISDKVGIKAQYKKLKKAWKRNIKNGNKVK